MELIWGRVGVVKGLVRVVSASRVDTCVWEGEECGSHCSFGERCSVIEEIPTSAIARHRTLSIEDFLQFSAQTYCSSKEALDEVFTEPRQKTQSIELSGFLLTTFWPILRLQMQEIDIKYGRQLQIHGFRSWRQLRRGGTPALVLLDGKKSLSLQNVILHRASDLWCIWVGGALNWTLKQ